MKNKYIIVLYLFLLISQIYCVPPKCITTKNVYTKSQVFIDKDGEKNVEWWVLEQLSQSQGAIYTDNELNGANPVINELAYYNIRNPDEPNPITSTYIQSYPNKSGKTIYNSLTYNDQPSNSGNSAHAKGFFIWNEEGGIHVIHSVPNSPETGYKPLFNFKENTLKSQHAQHSICITLSKEELHIIPKYIIYGNLNIQTINTVSPGSGAKRVSSAMFLYSQVLKEEVDKKKTGVIDLDVIDSKILATKIPKTFKELDGLMSEYIFDNKKNDGDPDIWNGVIYLNKWSQLADLILNKDITSSDTNLKPKETNVHYYKINESDKGRYFIQTTNINLYKEYSEKNKEAHKDGIKFFIVWHFIDSSKNDLPNGNNFKTMVHTQTKKGRGRNSITQAVESINISYRFETPWSKVIRADSGSDHSKMSYQFNDVDKVGSGGGGGMICFGDLNWQGKQEARGGGAFCSDKMKYLSEYFYRRVSIIRHPEDNQYLKKESLRLNSIAGQKLNLNVLITKYPSDLRAILGKRKLDFETKVKGYGDDKNYYHLNPFNIVYNEDKLFANEYNFGYENVYIPLLTKLIGQTTTNKYKSEFFDFNVFPSVKGEIILCDDNDVTCSFEKSKSYQLFKDIYVESTFTDVELDKFDHPIIEIVNEVIVPSIVSPFPDRIYVDLKTVKLVQQIYTKLLLSTNKNIIQLKEVQMKLEPFEFSDNEKNKEICKAYPNDPDSKIIKYLPGCQDLLIYCIILTENKQNVLGKIDSNDVLIGALGEYTKNLKDIDNSQWCIKDKKK
ncbi:hypothetical protein DDB_G0270642 [Dictyostelium discoideum AX4]|uniref:Uncharacterized protein n=1 Tax=Dictyostelium discoideum TaxID=44689 RepID=Q55D42_DICDI|nr:hypothetical protein DDB_G0270642 [Dictyostelium discoideum AX4]EAL72671.1 hypothetical protein DDB_G0270642 [Dictyostelium discoideum AX4]|eukprot:XP_646289.1 hypothetical protein DDB_G0270642 [Dictyostelium discoideum AX4]